MTTSPVGPDLTERAELIRRVSRLRVALEAASRDNGRLQRELRAARAENRRLRQELGGIAAHRAREEHRRMMSQPWSRNP
ncbi:MAG TPA: hypothetical protein VFN65_15875 [Solirubrobacteraceae bacterium]|nr:hypothetical protein [Solirubrobacteraceae bacterium]